MGLRTSQNICAVNQARMTTRMVGGMGEDTCADGHSHTPSRRMSKTRLSRLWMLSGDLKSVECSKRDCPPHLLVEELDDEVVGHPARAHADEQLPWADGQAARGHKQVDMRHAHCEHEYGCESGWEWKWVKSYLSDDDDELGDERDGGDAADVSCDEEEGLLGRRAEGSAVDRSLWCNERARGGGGESRHGRQQEERRGGKPETADKLESKLGR